MKKLILIQKCFLILILLITGPAKSEPILKEIGIPFISKFGRQEFNGGAQTWSVTQDDRGIMYFGNNNGLLEYDGNKWQLIPMQNNAIVREVFKSSDNKIFVGAYNQFGYLASDELGRTIYKSVSDELPSAYKEFGEIWNIIETPWGILFQSFSSIYLLKDKIIPLEINQSLNHAFKTSDRILIGHNQHGLMEITENGLKEIEGGKFFSGKTISSIMELNNGNLLIATSFSGVYTYDGKQFSKWDSPVSAIATDYQVYCGIQLNHNTFAYGTIKNGIFFFNGEGNIISNVNREKGLQNNSVLALYIDESDNLWAALDNGINYLNINSPVSQLFPEGSVGTGYVSCIHRDKIYFGSNQGLFYLEWDQEANKISNTIPRWVYGADGQVWNLQVIDGHLICGHHNGTFEIIDDRAIPVSKVLGGWKYVRISSNSPYLIGGCYTGLVLLRNNRNKSPHFEFIKKLEGFKVSSREMEVDNKGYLWVSHVNKGVYRISFNQQQDGIRNVDFYNSKNGLPSDYSNSVFKLKGSVLVSTVEGIYRFNARKQFFEKDEKITAVLNTGKIDKFYEDPYENIWHFTSNQLGVLRTNFQGSYYSELIPYKELRGNFVANYEHILATDNQSFIISTEDGFVHFDKSYQNQQTYNFRTLLRKVSSTNGELIFGGNFTNQENELQTEQPFDQNPEIPYRYNNLRFEVSANSFSSQDKIEFSFWLEGYESNWSKWSDRNFKDFPRINRGTYTLHIKARNESMAESEEFTYQFTMKPPWYLRPYMLVLYLMLFVLIIYLTFFLIKKKIEKEREILKRKQKKELTEKQKEFEHESLMREQEIIQLRNEKLQIENERNSAELENKSKELASIVMKISYSNELINRTRSQLMKVLSNMVHEQSKKQVQKLVSNLEQELNSQEDWKQFEVHFDKVHENFIQYLRGSYPSLTHKDLKLAAYLRMNLSTKEIAQLFNLSPRGVETSRYRLRKKMDLDRDANLTDFLLSI